MSEVQLLSKKAHIGLIDGEIIEIERITPIRRLGFQKCEWRACIHHGNASWSYIRYNKKQIGKYTTKLWIKGE